MASQEFRRSTATLAAWNLAGFNPISAERKANQLDGLTIIDAEIVVLVEVKPFAYFNELVDGMAEKGLIYNFVALQQTADLNIGILFKEGVEVGAPEFIEGSDGNNPDRRKAFAVDVKVGNFDCKIIALHLKSGRGKAEQEERDVQCKAIGEFITEQRAKSREDIILLGDFNMIPGQDISNFHHLGGDDLMDFVSSWDLQDRYSHILESGRANLLDGFAISRTFSTEYIRGSLRLFPLHWNMNRGREWFRTNVSDHLPFVATFRIDRSRD